MVRTRKAANSRPDYPVWVVSSREHGLRPWTSTLLMRFPSSVSSSCRAAVSLAAVLLLLMLPGAAAAQPDTAAPPPKPAEPELNIINLPTTKSLSRHQSYFRLTHR